MKPAFLFVPVMAVILLASCSPKESAGTPAANAADASKAAVAEAPAVEPASGPHAFVHLKNGSRVPGTIVASSKSDMVVAGDDGIEHKIPLGQIRSVEYAEESGKPPVRPSPMAPAPPVRPSPAAAAPPERKAVEGLPRQAGEPAAVPAPQPRAVTTKTSELSAGSEISVRTNEPIDSKTAGEGQTFDAQVTRDAKDSNGDVVIPRGSTARVVIKSASQGGRFHGASDLVLDLQSITIGGRPYDIDTVDVTKKGKEGVGANKRTAEYAGGGAAIGAVIGAIAGGGKGAAIGAGAGAGAGAIAQVITKGKAIKVPAESVLTFNLDKPLRVSRRE